MGDFDQKECDLYFETKREEDFDEPQEGEEPIEEPLYDLDEEAE